MSAYLKKEEDGKKKIAIAMSVVSPTPLNSYWAFQYRACYMSLNRQWISDPVGEYLNIYESGISYDVRSIIEREHDI